MFDFLFIDLSAISIKYLLTYFVSTNYAVVRGIATGGNVPPGPEPGWDSMPYGKVLCFE